VLDVSVDFLLSDMNKEKKTKQNYTTKKDN